MAAGVRLFWQMALRAGAVEVKRDWRGLVAEGRNWGLRVGNVGPELSAAEARAMALRPRHFRRSHAEEAGIRPGAFFRIDF